MAAHLWLISYEVNIASFKACRSSPDACKYTDAFFFNQIQNVKVNFITRFDRRSKFVVFSAVTPSGPASILKQMNSRSYTIC